MKPPFWMVCRSPRHAGSKTEPKERFRSEDDARTAAQALADANEAPFCILAVTATVWPKGQTDRLI